MNRPCTQVSGLGPQPTNALVRVRRGAIRRTDFRAGPALWGLQQPWGRLGPRMAVSARWFLSRSSCRQSTDLSRRGRAGSSSTRARRSGGSAIGRGLLCEFEGAGFEGAADFLQLGINLTLLGPGEPMAMYHRENDQEDFLVLAGEALAIVQGEERPLTAVGLRALPAGDEPCDHRRRRSAVPDTRGRRPRPHERPRLGRLHRG